MPRGAPWESLLLSTAFRAIVTFCVTMQGEGMDIAFRIRKLEKRFNSAAALRKAYGKRMSEAIMKRLAVLEAARHLALVPATPPERCHRLKRDRKGQFAVDLVQPYRLLFELNHEPLPLTHDGGIDMERVTAIVIVDVIDYH